MTGTGVQKWKILLEWNAVNNAERRQKHAEATGEHAVRRFCVSLSELFSAIKTEVERVLQHLVKSRLYGTHKNRRNKRRYR